MRKYLLILAALALLAAPLSATTFSRFGLSPGDPFTCTGATEGATYENTTSHLAYVCNGTAWTLFGGVGGSGTVNTVAKFTAVTTLGNSTITDDATVVTINARTALYSSIPAAGGNSFFRVTGTFPTTPLADIFGSAFVHTTAGSQAFNQFGLYNLLSAGYTGPNGTYAFTSINNANGTGADPFGADNRGNVAAAFISTTSSNAGWNIGELSIIGNAGSGAAISALHRVNGGGSLSAGAVIANEGGSATTRIGAIVGYLTATSSIGTTSAALIADNGVVAAPIFIARDNGTAMFTVADGGDLQINRTITAIGTTGNQTINKAAGTINIAAGGATVDLSNSLVTTSTIPLYSLRVADGTCTFVKSAVPTAGHLVFTLNANCTGTQSIGWVVLN